MKQHEKYYAWCEIDAAIQAGREVCEDDRIKWKAFQNTAGWVSERQFDRRFKDKDKDEELKP